VSPATAALLAVAAVLVWPGRLRGPAPAPAAVPSGEEQPSARRDSSAPRRRRVVLVGLVAGAAVALLLGGAPGVVVGVLVAVATAAALSRLEPRRDRDRRERLAAQAPLVVDLVAACLASGAALEPSLAAAARAVGPPVADELGTVVSWLRLGADPETAWAATDPALAGLARAVVRSSQTGAPLADLLPRVAAEARAVHRAQAEARVRTASVRLTAPLGAAFLPAFLLLGVVPVVASWLSALF
jgi:Flp pilus assembly protein TadB